jgi:hypothetical protein
MKTMPCPFRLLVMICLALILLGCGLPSFLNGIKGESSQFATGNGTQLLPNPADGLANLKSYHVSFNQDITGTLDGKPYERHTHIELGRVTASNEVDFTHEQKGSDTPAYFMRLIELDKAQYRWMGSENECQGSSADVPPLNEVVEPASLLLPILQGNSVGSEKINNVDAAHYQFDQDGVSQAEPKRAVSGEVWIAAQGAYVVKYSLTIPAPVKTSGKGYETTQTYTYELSQVNTQESLALPSGCLAVPVDIPAMADARDLQRASGWLSYTTASSAKQVVDLYLQKLPALRWTTSQGSASGEVKLPYTHIFEKAGQNLSLHIYKNDQNNLDVDLMISLPAKPSDTDQAGTTPTPELAATADPAMSGLPKDIPLYPGATNLVNQASFVKFDVVETPDVVAKFYDLKMVANGWKQFDETKNDQMDAKTWMSGNRTVRMIISFEDGKTTVVMTLPEE